MSRRHDFTNSLSIIPNSSADRRFFFHTDVENHLYFRFYRHSSGSNIQINLDFSYISVVHSNGMIEVQQSLSFSTSDTFTFTYSSAHSNYVTTLYTLDLDAGDTVYISGTNAGFSVSNNNNTGFFNFDSSAPITCGGRLMDLIDNHSYTTRISQTRAFNKTFCWFGNLISIDNLFIGASILSSYCFNSCFSYCTGLTRVPKDFFKEVTSYNTYALSSMFAYDTALQYAPVLYASSLSSYIYHYMFYGCTSLCSIEDHHTTPTSWSNTYTNNWVTNVASIGTFYKISSASGGPSDTRGVNAIPSGWTITYIDR